MHVKNELWTVEKFVGARDKIEEQPMYQRGAVWNMEKRRLLIDSILRQLDVPKIYLNKLSKNPTYKYQIIDGQQRLSSIWIFACDKSLTVDLQKPLNKSSWNGCSYDGLKKEDLKRFLEFEISVGIIQNATDDEVRELFARLQMGDKLTPAELRNSIRSAIGIEVRNIAENHKFFRNCKFSQARYKHHDLAAHAFALEINNGQQDLKAMNLREMYIKYKDSTPSTLSKRVAKVLSYLDSVQKEISGWIDRKWGFVDLYLLVTQKISQTLPSPKDLGEKFKAFENKRRKHNAKPEILLERSSKDKDMYKYIQAFKLSGGLSDNILRRNEILHKKLL